MSDIRRRRGDMEATAERGVALEQQESANSRHNQELYTKILLKLPKLCALN